MHQKIRKERITKTEFYDRGGFANSALFRKQSRGGAWRYYVNLDHGSARGVIVGHVNAIERGAACEENPVNRCPGCGITVFRSSDNLDRVCSTCKGRRS